MNKFFSKLKKETKLNTTIVINLFSTVILQGINFLTTPIFTRLLGTEQYGYYSIYSTWCSFIPIVMSLGTNSVVPSGRYYFKNDYYNFRNSIIAFSSIICLCFTFIFILFYNSINIIMNYTFSIYIVLLSTCFSQATISNISGILIYEKKAILNFIISVFLSAGTVIFSLLFIFYIKFDELYYARVYGHFIPYILSTIFLLLYVIGFKPFKIKIEFCKYALIVGFPVIFHTISNTILGLADRLMMEKLGIPISDIGIYSLYFALSSVLMIILGAFNGSFVPFYYDDIDNKNYSEMIRKIKNYIEVFTITCIGFLLLSREVSYIMADESFRNGINLIPYFVLSTYFIFMYHFPVNYEFFYRKTKIVAIGTVSAAVINIITNLFFIKKFGIYGAAFTTLLSYFLLYIFHYIIVNNMHEKSKYQCKFKFFAIGLVIVGVFCILFEFLKNFVYLRWTLGLLLGLFEMYRIWKRRCIF